MARTTVAKRLVFHVGGYDPITPHAGAQRRFAREIARFQLTWSVKACIAGRHDGAGVLALNLLELAQRAGRNLFLRPLLEFEILGIENIARLDVGHRDPDCSGFVRRGALLVFVENLADAD